VKSDLDKLVLLRAPGPIWAVAYDGKLLYAWRVVTEGHKPTSTQRPIPPGTVWTPISYGPEVSQLLKNQGILEIMVAKLADQMAAWKGGAVALRRWAAGLRRGG
jgi:hypothetical protein